jgi:PIN domain nuclease of toxin-antitoxin system
MSYLIDTHIFLWSLFSPEKNSKKVINILLNDEQAKKVSIITFWEISLKYSLKKITLKGITPEELPLIAKKNGFEIEPLNENIVSSFYQLPRDNKDPFDRMLAWQAIKQKHTLITKDRSFSLYKTFGLNTIW